MHLLEAQPGVVADGSEAVDLGQTPGDIVVLSAADTELASLAAARGSLGETFPTVRLANLMQLSHNASVDLYCEEIIAEARLVIVRLLGGKSYWPYGVEQIVETCAGTGAALVLLPGDDQPDPELAAHSRVGTEAYQRLWNFLLHGGAANARGFLAYAVALIGRRFDWREPAELPRAGIYWPGVDNPGLADLRKAWAKDMPVAALVFYRALVQADNVAPVRALIEALKRNGANCLPGKALALGETCFPEAVFGPLPHLYPFIVNDPGEGTQAKRRAQAVIVDHLTPPLTRAETYGPLAELELLVDEYFEAAGVDPRRLKMLREGILALATHVGLDRDCGIETADDHDTVLSKLDNYLCELKEMHIRGDLHVFGCSPQGESLSDLLVSMVRLPCGDKDPADASLMRAAHVRRVGPTCGNLRPQRAACVPWLFDLRL